MMMRSGCGCAKDPPDSPVRKIRKNARNASPLSPAPTSKKRNPAERKTCRNSCSSSRSRKGRAPRRRQLGKKRLNAMHSCAVRRGGRPFDIGARD